MWAQAIYVGKRPYNREQRTTEDGEVIPALKGRQYLFYSADWTAGENIDGMGKTRFETVEEEKVKEYETKLPKVGGFCTIAVRESFRNESNNLCKFVIAEEK